MPASTATTAIATSSSISVYARLMILFYTLYDLEMAPAPKSRSRIAAPVPNSGIISTVPHNAFIRYDRFEIPLKVPGNAEILRPSGAKAVSDPVAEVRRAIESPIGSEPLASLLQKHQPKSVVVTISDITRPVPNRDVLPPVLETIERQGVPKSAITILIATGMHRPTMDEEKLELLGERILSNYRVVDHRSDRREELVALPKPTRFGTTAWISRLYMEADFRIVTGFIEPHFMAGFSGGRKGICPGLVNVETVKNFHGFRFLDSPYATNFSLEGNPLHEEAMDVVEQVGIEFLVNVGLTEDKRIAGVFAGHWKVAFDEGVKQVRQWTMAECSSEKDVVITCGGGYPLDKTLYQSGKGMCSALPIVKQGGVVVCASACSEGLGSPSFTSIMREWGGRWQEFLDWIASRDEVLHDQWGFQMHCKVLQRVGVENLRFACCGIPADELRSMSLTPIVERDPSEDEAEAVRRALQHEVDQAKNKSIAILPDGPYVVPVLKEVSNATS